MSWTLDADVEAYAAHARPLLERDPARNTVALTALGRLTSGGRFSEVTPIFGWFREGSEVTGAVFLTPPYELGLAVVPLHAVDALVHELRARKVNVPGVAGERAVADAFTAAWLDPSAQRGVSAQRLLLYVLETLVPPDPMPAGSARIATLDDFDVLESWTTSFLEEAGVRTGGLDGEILRSRIQGELYLVWRTSGGIVAMAGRQVTAATVARVGPVYTPPEHRRKGYGAAVTAACTAHALASGAARVVLFADLANPVSNSIYQGIGYRPIGERVVYGFPGG